MTADLRTRIAQALCDHEQSGSGLEADRYPLERYLCCADAVLAVLERTEGAAADAEAIPDPEPPCEWFHWIGQPFYSCDQCGRPAWEHRGRLAPPESLFGDEPERGVEWTDDEREACRRKWEPAMLADQARRERSR